MVPGLAAGQSSYVAAKRCSIKLTLTFFNAAENLRNFLTEDVDKNKEEKRKAQGTPSRY